MKSLTIMAPSKTTVVLFNRKGCYYIIKFIAETAIFKQFSDVNFTPISVVMSSIF